MKYKLFITAIVTVLFSISSYADSNKSPSFQALSGWTNESGSTLYIESVDSNGLLTGTYTNKDQGYACQNISYPVTGWIYGTAITFNTMWESATESCNSITAWTGFYSQGTINTLWQLTINGSTSTSQILQGNDTFKPSPILIRESLILK